MRNTHTTYSDKTLAWAVLEIKRQVECDPLTPARLDIRFEGDVPRGVEKLGIALLHARIARPWQMFSSEHIDPTAREEGFTRIAFCGVDYVEPAPIRQVRAPRGAASRLAQELRQKYGPNYHVQLCTIPTPTIVIWRGEVWLARQTRAFYPVEVVQFLGDNIAEMKALSSDAMQQRTRVKKLREIAPIGGKATAHYTDADVTDAFTEYRKRNPTKSAYEAATALIRPGRALSRFGQVTGPYNRIGRIAAGEGITRDEWYRELDR